MPGPTDRPAGSLPTSSASASGIESRARSRPSRAFRPVVPGSPPAATRVLAMVAIVASVSVQAGFLELAVFQIQVLGLNLVDLNSLRISRHVGWMIPVAGSLVTLGLAIVILGPLLVWIALRKTFRQRPAPSWVRPYVGWVLGCLVFLAPLLAVRGLHAMAALVLALGLGIRVRSLVLGSSPRWNRLAMGSGAIAVVALPLYALGEWKDVAGSPLRAAALPPREAPNLLWIVLDTTRADRLSLYGYERETTPELSRWAKHAIVFDEARSTAPWTLPSHVSMFTSLWPHEHGARIDRPYLGSMPTVAEHLGEQGYVTAGFAANTGMCNACFGVGRGFDHYMEMVCNHEVSLKATLLNSAIGTHALKTLRRLGVRVPTQFPFPGRSLAPTIADRGRRWLDEVHAPMAQAPRPFFLFLNFMDAHGPYLPLAGYDRRFSGDRPLLPNKKAVPTTGSDAQRALLQASFADKPAKQKALDDATRLLSDLYDDCVRGLDQELGKMLDGLQRAGKLDNTWVVITADHGEYFGEHQLFGHGGRLHNEVTHVPLMLIPPMKDTTIARGQRIASPVSLRDLPSTVSDLLLPGDLHPYRGRSLARFWGEGETPASDPILMQMEEQAIEGEDVAAEGIVKTDALVHKDHILIRSSGRSPELFRLDDRKQGQDLGGQPHEQERLSRMQKVLDALLSPEAAP